MVTVVTPKFVHSINASTPAVATATAVSTPSVNQNSTAHCADARTASVETLAVAASRTFHATTTTTAPSASSATEEAYADSTVRLTASAAATRFVKMVDAAKFAVQTVIAPKASVVCSAIASPPTAASTTANVENNESVAHLIVAMTPASTRARTLCAVATPSAFQTNTAPSANV